MAVLHAPAKTDAETCSVASEREVILVVDEEVERVVGERGLDCGDGVGDIGRRYQGYFNGHSGR